MAKAPTFDTIVAGYTSATALNNNFSSITTSFQNTLSLDGSTPNSMLADFDLNSNDILNGGTINAVDIVVNGTSLAAQLALAAASAAAAAVSETNAATSETNAAASFDAFDDIYLGAFATAPTLDNDGDALATGALYFDTVSNSMFVYSGSAWVSFGGVVDFTDLGDVDTSYTGDALKVLRVNAGETGIEFVTLGGSEPSDGDKGDITVSGGGLTWNLDAGVVTATELSTDAVTTVKITDDNVTYAKIQNVVADNVILGNNSGAGSIVDELTATEVTAMLNAVTSGLKGLAPASGGGTTNFLRADATWAAPGTGDTWELLHVRDEQASGSDGGSFTSGAWQTRTLNTSVTNEITGASLSSNQFTLPAGTYYIKARAPASEVSTHKARLQNVTDASTTIVGSTSSCIDPNMSDSFVEGKFTIAGAKAFEIQHRCSATKATDGFGQGAGFSVVEVFTEVLVWKKS